MDTFVTLLQQGNAWLFVPSAILLGALHGLEPGHSKTMMAAFIVAIRGTVFQATLLGLCATVSHTAIVWAIALAGLHFGRQFNTDRTEPYFQLASAALIIAVAAWMLWRTYREHQRERNEVNGEREHHHHDEVRRIDLGHGEVAQLEIFERGVPPRFRLTFEKHSRSALRPEDNHVTVDTRRPDGSAQRFTFVSRQTYLESIEEIPEPHEFTARVRIEHGNHGHDYDVVFEEGAHHHSHDGLDVSGVGYQDAHELAHTNDIRRRFANRTVTTGQIVMFGLIGGLVPCPASITVLLICLQLKQFTLGVTLVLCFSIGLALTMVLSGTIAALSVRYAGKHWTGFGTFARRAPYASSALIILVGLYTGYLGWRGLAA